MLHKRGWEPSIHKHMKVIWPGSSISGKYCEVIMANELNMNQQCGTSAQKANDMLDVVLMLMQSKSQELIALFHSIYQVAGKYNWYLSSI